MKIKDKWYDYVFNLLGAVALASATVMLAVKWNALEQVPRHYDFTGQVDAWGGKGSLIFLVVLGWGFYALLYAVSRFPKIWNIPETTPADQKEYVYRLSKGLLLYMRTVIAVLFSYLLFQSMYVQQSIGSWFLPCMLVVLFGGLIFFLAKIFSAAAVFK